MVSLVMVLGTRAEFLKCVPLIRSFERAKIDFLVVLTGQNFVDDLIKRFQMPHARFVNLDSFAGVSTSVPAGIRKTPRLVRELRRMLQSANCKCVICHGDTATTFATSLATQGLQCAVSHVEAGLRSHSFLEPFPEEFFRTVVDRRSDVLFAPSKIAVENLDKEGINGDIVFSGNTICDLLEITVGKLEENSKQKEEFVLVTTHRYENIFLKSRLKKILDILSLSRFPVIWPLHQMTRDQLRRFDLLKRVERMNVQILPPLQHEEFVGLLLKSKYIITDGGSIEEEATILGKYSLLLRKRTERGEGVKMGISFLTGLDPRRSGVIMSKLETDLVNPTTSNPYIADQSPSTIITNYLQSKYC